MVRSCSVKYPRIGISCKNDHLSKCSRQSSTWAKLHLEMREAAFPIREIPGKHHVPKAATSSPGTGKPRSRSVPLRKRRMQITGVGRDSGSTFVNGRATFEIRMPRHHGASQGA